MSGKAERDSVSVSLDKSQFDSLIKAIDNFVKVLAAAQIRQEAGTETNARFLKVFELSEQEIADLLGVTQPAVNQALRSKKKKTTEKSKGSNDTVQKT